ncbi:MAG: 50S ribosomal protein L24 [bacterium]
MKIKINDKVKIIAGKDKGKTGKVIQIMPKEELIVAEGINLMTKHVKGQRDGQPGQKIQFPCPLKQGKALVICPSCDKSVRVGYKILENKEKARVCNKCGQNL